MSNEFLDDFESDVRYATEKAASAAAANQSKAIAALAPFTEMFDGIASKLQSIEGAGSLSHKLVEQQNTDLALQVTFNRFKHDAGLTIVFARGYFEIDGLDSVAIEEWKASRLAATKAGSTHALVEAAAARATPRFDQAQALDVVQRLLTRFFTQQA